MIGLRKLWTLFEHPAVYRLNQLSTGYLLSLAYKRLLRKCLTAPERATVLDIGCGTGDYALLFPLQQYVGIDVNSDYIERARRAYGHLKYASFVCADLDRLPELGLIAEQAYCVAVTHHLTDDEVVMLVRNALATTKRSFVVVDLYLPAIWRNPLGYFLVRIDRGRYGRTLDALKKVLASAGASITGVFLDFGFPYHAMAVALRKSDEIGQQND